MPRSRFAPSLLAVACLLLAGCGDARDTPSDDETPAQGLNQDAPDDLATLPEGGQATDGLDIPEGLDEALAQEREKQTTAGRYLGADASWPQCPEGMGIPEKRSKGAPMPTEAAEFVVLGLTNGPSFTPNPCLADQVHWVKQRKLWIGAYAVHSYPDAARLEQVGDEGPYDAGSATGRLKNAGYASALFNLATMEEAGLRTPAIWVDVEPVPVFEWSSDRAANAAVVQGAVRAYQEQGYRVGVYSTPTLWDTVVGDWRPGLPEWRAAGQTSMAEALARCGDDWSFSGGEAVLGQWVEDDRDRNVTCPGQGDRLGDWFRRTA